MIIQTKYFKSHRSLSSFLSSLLATGGEVVATLRDGEYIVLFYTKRYMGDET